MTWQMDLIILPKELDGKLNANIRDDMIPSSSLMSLPIGGTSYLGSGESEFEN
jgi:hypothetical protein